MLMKSFCNNLIKSNLLAAPYRISSLFYSNGSSGGKPFESNIALKNIYPKSSLDVTRIPSTPVSENESLFSGYIPLNKLSITYSRSSGPGGQNVNKVNTKVDLRFKVSDASWISDEIKNKLREKYPNTINSEDFFVIRSERTRSQQLNLADAVDKLRYMIHRAIHVIPPPSTKDIEIKRRRQEKAARERLRVKRERSLIKRYRQNIDVEL